MPDPLNAGGNEQTMPKGKVTYGYTKKTKKLKKTKPSKGASVNDFDDTVAKYKSPAKIAKVGYDNPDYKQGSPTGYAPFKMTAADHDNSPMEKNHGSAEQRGFGAPTKLNTFGIGDTEFLDQEGTDASTALNYGAAVGSSPAKLLPLDMIRNAGVSASGAEGETVAPHGDEAHTGGKGGKTWGGIGGAVDAVGGGGEEEAPWEVMKSGAFGDMDKGARKDYMGGLDNKQRTQQMISNMKGRSIGGLFGGGGGGGMFGSMFSDIRLKEKIEKTGNSPSGIPIYEFNYIGSNDRYSGAMAQDVLEISPSAVSVDASGYYKVNYNNIDVDMHLIN